MRWALLALLWLGCGRSGEPPGPDTDGQVDTDRAVDTDGPPICEPVLQRNPDGTPRTEASGLEFCHQGDDVRGFVRRIASAPNATPSSAWIVAAEECESSCTGQTECFPYGMEDTCSVGCVTDADCGADQICAVPGSFGQNRVGDAPMCVWAECRTDADCAEGPCYVAHDPCATNRWTSNTVCSTPLDECHSDADCGGSQFCQWDGHFFCAQHADCE